VASGRAALHPDIPRKKGTPQGFPWKKNFRVEALKPISKQFQFNEHKNFCKGKIEVQVWIPNRKDRQHKAKLGQPADETVDQLSISKVLILRKDFSSNNMA
jgi:hypothetical protein